MLNLPGVSDPRVLARGAWLFEQIVTLGTVALNRLGGDYAGEMAAHRYLSSPYVAPERILAALGERTGHAAAGRRVVAAQDTTEINFSGRDRSRRGLGLAGDGKSLGFFIHAVVAVDVEDEAVLGVADAKIWTRSSRPAEHRHARDLADRESARWVWGRQAAGERLRQASQIVVVADREGDIYSQYAQRPAHIDLVVRAQHDRRMEGADSLFQIIAARPGLITTPVQIAPQGVGDKGRIAQVTLRSGRVRIPRPSTARPQDEPLLDLGLVEAREENPPVGCDPLHWRLLTTLPIETAQDAQEVVRLYRLRWRIEEVFRALKRDGLGLEHTQVQQAGRLFCLAALALGAAARILPGRCSRRREQADERCPRPASAPSRRGHQRLTSRLNAQAAEPSPGSLTGLALLGDRKAWRLELPRQAPRSKDHGPRLATLLRRPRRIPHRNARPTSVNPVALWGRTTCAAGQVGASDTLSTATRFRHFTRLTR